MSGSVRALVTRCAIAAATTVLVLASVAGCVQAPTTEDAIGVPQSAAPTASPYRPDAMPTDLPDAVVPTDAAANPATAEDPPDLPVTAPANNPGAPATTRTAAPASTAGPATVAAPQTTSAQVVVTTAPPPPTTTAAKPATTSAPTQGGTTAALVGPGPVDITCTGSGGKRRAVLTWQNKGFSGTITINGKVFQQGSTTSLTFSASTSESASGHGYCSGSVGGQSALRTY